MYTPVPQQYQPHHLKRKDALPAAQAARQHNNAMRAKEHVEALEEQFRVYSDALEVPEVDHEVISKHRNRLNVIEDEQFLIVSVAALKATCAAADRVTSLLQRREELLAVISMDVQLRDEGAISSADLKKRLDFGVQMLQGVLVDIVEAVEEWRQLLSHPLPFHHDEFNVLLKLLEDALDSSRQPVWDDLYGEPMFNPENPCGIPRCVSLVSEDDRAMARGNSLALMLHPIHNRGSKSSSLHKLKGGSRAGSFGNKKAKERSSSINVSSYQSFGQSTEKPKRTPEEERALLEMSGGFPHTLPHVPRASKVGDDVHDSATPPLAARRASASPSRPTTTESGKRGSTVSGNSAQGTTSSFFERLEKANFIIRSEYATMVRLFKGKIECCENGVHIVTLRGIFDQMGPNELPEHRIDNDRMAAVNSLRAIAHMYPHSRREELKLLEAGESKDLFSNFTSSRQGTHSKGADHRLSRMSLLSNTTRRRRTTTSGHLANTSPGKRHHQGRDPDWSDPNFMPAYLTAPKDGVCHTHQRDRVNATSSSPSSPTVMAEYPLESQLLVLVTIRCLQRRYKVWVRWLRKKRQRRSIADSLMWLADKELLRRRFHCMMQLVRQRREERRAAEAKAVVIIKQKADVEPAGPAGGFGATTSTPSGPNDGIDQASKSCTIGVQTTMKKWRQGN